MTLTKHVQEKELLSPQLVGVNRSDSSFENGSTSVAHVPTGSPKSTLNAIENQSESSLNISSATTTSDNEQQSQKQPSGQFDDSMDFDMIIPASRYSGKILVLF